MPKFAQTAEDITSADGERKALSSLANARELAVDVEADAMHAFRARLCFVQLGTDRDIFLLDTLVPEVRAIELAPLFGDASRTKFFHAAGGDLQYLAEAGVRVNGLFDTHRAATLLGWPKVGLADLARERLGVELAKEHQQSDFSVRPLPPEIREYIANVVRYLCEIGRQVREECRRVDVLEEVDLDCQRLSDEAAARPDIARFRPKLSKGTMSASQFQLATVIAQSLHVKRLEWAEADNVPMGRMLSNAALSALATKPPSTLKDLARTQGVNGRFVRQHGEEVLADLRAQIERLRRGELGAAEADPGKPDPQRRRREEALKQFRTLKAAERKVTASVVLPNALIEDLAIRPPKTLEELAAFPYFGTKRVGLYGSDLMPILTQK